MTTKTQRSGVASGLSAGRRPEAGLGHKGSSSSANEPDPFAHQAGRDRRWSLRKKVRRFARRDYVQKTKWFQRFEVDGRTGDTANEWVEGQDAMRQRDSRYTGCGHRRRAGFNHVGVRAPLDGRAGFTGLQSCGSVWVCPVCAGKIMRKRADELGKALRWARREGKTVAMITLTVRHKNTDPLTQVWDAVSHGWGKVTSGRAWVSEKPEKFAERDQRWMNAYADWKAGIGRPPYGAKSRGLDARPVRNIGDQEQFGVLGWARAAEVKLGDNGWHVHLHVVVVLDRDGEGATATYNGEVAAMRLGASMFKRWNAAMPAEHRASEKHGYQVSVHGAAEKRLAEYLAKDGLDDREAVERSIDAKGRSVAMEVTHGASKEHMKSAHAGVTPFQLLDRIDPGVQKPAQFKRDLAKWYEWVDGSEGRRQLTWSKGFRELVGLGAELSDEEVAAEDEGGETLLTLPPESWSIVRDDGHVLLELVEREGLTGLRAYLDRYEWMTTDPATGEVVEGVGVEYGLPVDADATTQGEFDL